MKKFVTKIDATPKWSSVVDLMMETLENTKNTPQVVKAKENIREEFRRMAEALDNANVIIREFANKTIENNIHEQVKD